VKQFPVELYSEFLLDMLEVYNDYESGRLRFSHENSRYFINSLFLFGGVKINKTNQAFIQNVQTEAQASWQ
jgi:hypothetical protein